MGQKLNMKVNRLPVRTWNWLRMNESSLDKIEITDSCAVFTEGAAESAATIPHCAAVSGITPNTPASGGILMTLISSSSPAKNDSTRYLFLNIPAFITEPSLRILNAWTS